MLERSLWRLGWGGNLKEAGGKGQGEQEGWRLVNHWRGFHKPLHQVAVLPKVDLASKAVNPWTAEGLIHTQPIELAPCTCASSTTAHSATLGLCSTVIFITEQYKWGKVDPSVQTPVIQVSPVITLFPTEPRSCLRILLNTALQAVTTHQWDPVPWWSRQTLHALLGLGSSGDSFLFWYTN